MLLPDKLPSPLNFVRFIKIHHMFFPSKEKCRWIPGTDEKFEAIIMGSGNIDLNEIGINFPILIIVFSRCVILLVCVCVFRNSLCYVLFPPTQKPDSVSLSRRSLFHQGR